MASESSSKTDFSAEENTLRKRANARLLKLLEDPNAEVPAGQLMSFVAKVGFQPEVERAEVSQIKTQNIIAILPGLPPERQEALAAGLENQAKEARRVIEAARKELPSGK